MDVPQKLSSVITPPLLLLRRILQLGAEHTPALQYPFAWLDIVHCVAVVANIPFESQQAPSLESGVHCLP